MKKLLEFNTFDTLKDKESREFLDKVKEQNPEEYSRFASIIMNKGLEIAKQKYRPYEPLEIKKRVKALKSEDRQRIKEETDTAALDRIKTKTDQVQAYLKNSPLKKAILKYLSDDPNIDKFFKVFGFKKEYQDTFKQEMKKPLKLEHKLNRGLEIDKLIYHKSSYVGWDTDFVRTNVLTIRQYLNLVTNKVTFYISFKMPTDDYFEDYDARDQVYYNSRLYEIEKSELEQFPNFIIERNKYINAMNSEGLTINELAEKLVKFSHLLSKKFFDDYKFHKDAEKYNL